MSTKLLTLILSLAASSLPAAEIQFKTPAQCDTAVVKLGDIADITGQNADTLKEIALFPAPISGGQRTYTATQIRDLLAGKNVRSMDHVFRGVEQITVHGPQKGDSEFKSGVNAKLNKKIETELTETIITYLNRCTTDGNPENAIPWSVKLHVTPEQEKEILGGEKIVGIYGGKNPLVGSQEFQVEMQKINPATGKRKLIRFFTEISLPPRVIIARRSLERGKILNENDIQTVYRSDLKGTDFYSDPKDVIGKAVSNNIRDGAVFTSHAIRKPLFVRKGEIVTVVSKAAGVTVTSSAKALEDGSQGDLISLDQQLKQTKEKGRSGLQAKGDTTFVAKVAAIGTVEIFADSPKY